MNRKDKRNAEAVELHYLPSIVAFDRLACVGYF